MMREREGTEREREREREREANDKECKQDEVPICVRALFVPPVRLCCREHILYKRTHSIREHIL